MTYLRIQGRDTWHFHPDCQHYRRLIKRKTNVMSRKVKPLSAELCNECLAKARKTGWRG